ncbi:MAG: hypothetical protein L0Y35_02635 [Flammeovirgaceae bacterium]|nr:hypothetical protein [Flammeovirgaceae bacterium]
MKRTIDEAQINEFHRIQHELLETERRYVIAMRKEGIIRMRCSENSSMN